MVLLFHKYKSTYNSWCAQKIMEAMTPSLIKSSEEVLRDNLTDSDKFQSLYYEILENKSMAEDQPLAQKVGPLTQSQLYLLQSQVLAYKHLIRNIPVPTNLNWTGLHSNIWQSQKQKLTTKLVTYYRDKIQKEQEFKSMITGAIRLPFKDNPQQNTEEIKKILAKTQEELDQLLKEDNFTAQTRLKLSIEKRFLSIREIYYRVFNKILSNIKNDNKSVRLFEQQLLDRNYFRREKLQKNRNEGNRVQKLQNQVKSDHERRKKIKHKEFMQHLRIHKQQFLEWHRKKQKDRKKISNQAKSNYDLKKKEKEMIQDKKDLERLEALKKQDMVTYFKLVELEKNNKIKQLLNQTDKFLKELGAKVLIQKGTSQDDGEEGNEGKQIAERINEETLESTFNNSNKIYYNLTHTVKEDIKKQPTILEGGQLKNYQLIGLQWLVSLYNNNLNGILADEMGLGKTIQTISLLSYLIEFKKNYGPFLIVVPLSTISNWMSEFDKWAPSVRKIVYRGNPTTRNEIQKLMKSTKWNVCITTYDFILKDRLRLNKYDWKYIIIDEGHKMKNAKSKFAGVLGQQYHSNHRLLLTGTPLQNNLGQLWALLNFLLPKVFNSCDDFQKWFSIAISKKTGQKQAVSLTEQQQLLIINRLHQVLRPFLLRRVKKEVESQLPDKKEHVIKVQLSAWQKLIYDNISRKTALQFDNNSGKISTTTLTNLMMQLRKCCNHPYMFLKNYDDICYHDWIFRSSGKFELIDRILPKLKEFNHRVLIFTQMTHLMDIMQIYFDYKGIKHLRLDGSTKADDRGQRTTLFNEANSQYDVFLLSTRAGGLGLNLQTADTVILFDSDWNPQMDLQAQDRAHRIGQKKEVIVLRFITNTPIEQAILKKAGFKMNLDELFIQGGLYNLNSSEVERKQKIQQLLKRRNKDQESSRDQIPDDEQINRCISRSQQELTRFQQMDQQRYEREKKIYKNFCQQKESTNDNDGQQQIKAINYRLMTYDQIPTWFVQAPKALTEKTRQYGRGNRVRKQVNYCDDLIDDQYLKGEEEQEEQEEESSLIDVPKRKRRGRGSVKQVEKSKSADLQEEEEQEEENSD